MPPHYNAVVRGGDELIQIGLFLDVDRLKRRPTAITGHSSSCSRRSDWPDGLSGEPAGLLMTGPVLPCRSTKGAP